MTHRIERIDVFQALTPEESDRLAPLARWRTVEQGQTIVEHHDDQGDVYLIAEGRVDVTLFSVTGRKVGFLEMGPGSSFGEVAAIDGQPRSATVIALERCEIGAMSRDAYLKAVSDHPKVALAVMRKLTDMVRRLSQRVYDAAAPGAARICLDYAALADAARSGESARLRPAPKQSAIAARVNSHREAVSRVTSSLVKKGLLVKERGGLYVPSVGALRAEAERLRDPDHP